MIKSASWFLQKIAKLCLTLIRRRNVSEAPNPTPQNHFLRIMWTEDWCNGCWKFSFAITRINNILKMLKQKTLIWNCNIFSHYCWFTVFVIQQMQPWWPFRTSFKNTKEKILQITKFFTLCSVPGQPVTSVFPTFYTWKRTGTTVKTHDFPPVNSF